MPFPRDQEPVRRIQRLALFSVAPDPLNFVALAVTRQQLVYMKNVTALTDGTVGALVSATWD